MVNIKLIPLFNKELIGVYLYIDVGCNRASYRVGRLLKGLHCLCQGGTGVVLFLQTVGRLVKDLDFFIVCVCLGGGGFFLQRARRLVKGLYLCTDVPVL